MSLAIHGQLSKLPLNTLLVSRSIHVIDMKYRLFALQTFTSLVRNKLETEMVMPKDIFGTQRFRDGSLKGRTTSSAAEAIGSGTEENGKSAIGDWRRRDSLSRKEIRNRIALDREGVPGAHMSGIAEGLVAVTGPSASGSGRRCLRKPGAA